MPTNLARALSGARRVGLSGAGILKWRTALAETMISNVEMVKAIGGPIIGANHRYGGEHTANILNLAMIGEVSTYPGKWNRDKSDQLPVSLWVAATALDSGDSR